MGWDHAAEEHKYDDIRMRVHHRSRAVSYTHLDVYNRQGWYHVRNQGEGRSLSGDG